MANGHNRQEFRINDFRGGMRLRRDGSPLGENECAYLMNVEIDPLSGGLRRRQNVKFATASGTRAIDKVFTAVPVRTAAGTQVITAATVPTSEYAGANAASAANIYYHAVTASGGEVRLTQNDMGIDSQCMNGGVSVTVGVDDLVYLGRGHDLTVYTWNGSVATALTASATGAWQNSLATPTGTHAPKCEIVCSHGGYMWAAHTNEDGTEYPNRVRFSHPGFPQSWREDDTIEIPDGGPNIVGLFSFAGALLVVKSEGVFAVLGGDIESFQVVRLSANGSTNGRHCAILGDKFFFWSMRSGVQALGGDLRELGDVSDPIRHLFDQRYFTNSAGESASSLCAAGGKLWLNLRTDGASTTAFEPTVTRPLGYFGYSWSPAVTFVWDPQLNAWTANTYGSLTADEVSNPTVYDNTGMGFMQVFDLPVNTNAARGGVFAALGSGAIANPTWMLVTSGLYTGDDMITSTGPETYDVAHPHAVVRTRWFDLGSTLRKKRWFRPTLTVREQNATYEYVIKSFRDWDENTVVRSLTLSFTGNDDNGTLVDKAGPLGTARSQQLLIYFPRENTDGEFSLQEIAIPVAPRNQRI